jgi:AraC family transcriptional regulator
MDWLAQLNEAINYIEENLDTEIDMEHVAQLACCSSYHFQRMFSYMANVPLSEYIRRRKMTKAAFDLQNGEEKIIDIALRYGYDSPTAFNRAFHTVHGIAPSGARQPGVVLKSFQPISFKITIRGDVEMNYRIEKKEAFRIVGVKMAGSWSDENQEGFTQVPQFWAEHAQKGTIPQLLPIMDQQPMGVLGVSIGNWQETGKFDYYIAVASSQPAPQGMVEVQIPETLYAVFECKGAMPNAIQSLQGRIMTEWLPNSGYQYADGADIEQYGEGDQTSEDYVCWVWVPIKK